MDQWNKLPPQYKLLVGVGVLGVVAGLFYYLVIMEQDSQIQQLKVGYRQAQKELEQFKDFRGEIEIAELREEYAQVIKRIEENKKSIPDKERLPQFLSGLESDALEAGLTIVSKEQKGRNYEDFYYSIPVKFEVTGSYLDLVRFLKLLSLPGKRLVNISLFDIKVLETKKKKGKKDEGSSPFSSSGRVATAESEISATFIAEGFVYTGGGGGDKQSKAKKGKK